MAMYKNYSYFLSFNNNNDMFFVAEDLGHGNQFPSPLVGR